MMSRKHFNAIAKILREHGASEALIRSIAEWLKQQNPRFDTERFLETCRPAAPQQVRRAA